MRFRGTVVLLLVCAAFGAYLYFYEIKGGQKAETAKQEENRLWKVDSNAIQQLDLTTPDGHITAIRSGDKGWKITAPRQYDADSDELNRLAGSAADMSRESVLETDASNLSTFGLNPAQVALGFKTKDGKEYKIQFGINNPTGSSTYAAVPGKNQVFLVAGYTASTFNKKLNDLRNHNILNFEQFETQSVDLASAKGKIQLVKDNEKWWMQDKERMAADTSAVNSVLSELSTGKIKEFFDGNPDEYGSLGFDKPTADVRLILGKDKAIKHLLVGVEKSKLLKKGEKPKPEPKKEKEANKEGEKKEDKPASPELYIAKDESRPELFFVDKEFVDKLSKSPEDMRDKALASFQRWDIDNIVLTNSRGTFTFSRAADGGDWVLGDAKKKTKWDAVNGIMDALEKPVKGFVDNPGAPATYGFDKPSAHVILKQAGAVKLDCLFGKEAKDGIYAQVKGESPIKIADKDSLDKLNKAEADFIEPPPPAPAAPAKK
jgi:hypothetical protein